MPSVRRFACVLVVLLWLTPAGLRLALSDADSEALRCAIACGHAAKAGAACCPMAGAAPREAAMAACPSGDAQSVAPSLSAQPAVPAAVHRLIAPEGGFGLAWSPQADPGDPASRTPDHVPLLLS
jgi:hypothetical protein